MSPASNLITWLKEKWHEDRLNSLMKYAIFIQHVLRVTLYTYWQVKEKAQVFLKTLTMALSYSIVPVSHERDSEPVWKKDPDAAKWTPASVVFINYVCGLPTLGCQNVLWVREAYEVKEKVKVIMAVLWQWPTFNPFAAKAPFTMIKRASINCEFVTNRQSCSLHLI